MGQFRYLPTSSKYINLEKNFQDLLEQVEPEVLNQQNVLLAKVAVESIFPGVTLEELEMYLPAKSGEKVWKKLMELWKSCEQFEFDLRGFLNAYSKPKAGLNGNYSEFCAEKNEIEKEAEVEWKLIEFLQISCGDWKKYPALSVLEENVMKSLENFAKQRVYQEADVKNLSFLFDGNQETARAFLEKNKTKKYTLFLDKDTLDKVCSIAYRTILSREENGKRILELLQLLKENAFPRNSTYESYKVAEGDVVIRMILSAKNRECYELRDFSVDGLSGSLKIVITGPKEEYHPILRCQDIRKFSRYQSYAKMYIEAKNGEERKQVEIDIPRIDLIEKDAFKHIDLQELEIQGTVDQIAIEAFEN